jgi:hypothetical protein
MLSNVFGITRRRVAAPQISSSSDLAEELLVEPETPEAPSPPATPPYVSARPDTPPLPSLRDPDDFEKKVAARLLLFSIYVVAAFLVCGQRWRRVAAEEWPACPAPRLHFGTAVRMYELGGAV